MLFHQQGFERQNDHVLPRSGRFEILPIGMKLDSGMLNLSAKELTEAGVILRRNLDQRNLSNEIMLSTKISPALFTGCVHFDCLLKNQQGFLSTTAVFSGIFNQGQQDTSLGYVDGDYFENVAFQSINISLTDTGLDVPFFKILGELVPSGGSLLVSYTPLVDESRVHKETEQALGRGYPPVATPLGYLLFLAGCGMKLKDRRYTQDKREISGKLQGFKPLNAEERKRKGLSLIRELHQFIGTKSEDDDLARACRTRAFATIEKTQTTYG